MDRRRRTAIWVVAVLAVMGLVAPLALAFASIVDGDDEDDAFAAIGNDVGRPLPVDPDGVIYPGIEPNDCALAAIRPTSVVAIEELDDPIRAVRELGAPRLFDVWSTTTETLTPPNRTVSGPVDRFWVDAGTNLPNVFDDDGQIVFGVILEGGRSGDLYVLAVGRSDDAEFRFEWPCPDVLNLEWVAAAEALGRPADAGLAIEFLLRE